MQIRIRGGTQPIFICYWIELGCCALGYNNLVHPGCMVVDKDVTLTLYVSRRWIKAWTATEGLKDVRAL